jgi:hypothetical protein
MMMRFSVIVTVLVFLVERSPAFGHERTLHLLEARLAAAQGSGLAPVGPGPSTRLTLEVVDSKTQRSVSGLVRVLRADGMAVALEGLYNRAVSLEQDAVLRGWHVVHGRATVSVPRQPVSVECFSGLETELVRRELDLSEAETLTVRLELKRFFNARAKGLRSANTHLHLKGLSREKADRYLREVTRGDSLDLLFVSHLERYGDDHTYITNEEHRHNFTPYGEGYGHVMLLNLKKLIQPVSIGPGITNEGHDGIPLRRGIETAHRDGATAIFCHSAMGFEDVPDWVDGLLDAHNIFDGGVNGSYEGVFYRFLNIGLRVPFSTGTDWFIYDFSRVYVPVKGKLTVKKWLRALRDGRSFITNGTLLELSVNDQGIGGTVALTGPGSVKVRAKGVGRQDFSTIELVKNGFVVATARSRVVDRHVVAELETELVLDGPAWLALRTPLGRPKNELGETMFAHTSPVYIEVAGKKAVFLPDVARSLIADMRESVVTIGRKGKFETDGDRDDILGIYQEGIRTLEKRLATAE